MALLGIKPPVMVWEGRVYDFPAPAKGDDKQVYVPLVKVYENLDGERIHGAQSWRFEKEYVFTSLATSGLYDVLVAVYNRGNEVMWIPHADVPFVRYAVHIEDLALVPVSGLVLVDKVRFKVIGVRPVYKVPSLDNMISGIWPFRRGVI